VFHAVRVLPPRRRLPPFTGVLQAISFVVSLDPVPFFSFLPPSSRHETSPLFALARCVSKLQSKAEFSYILQRRSERSSDPPGKFRNQAFFPSHSRIPPPECVIRPMLVHSTFKSTTVGCLVHPLFLAAPLSAIKTFCWGDAFLASRRRMSSVRLYRLSLTLCPRNRPVFDRLGLFCFPFPFLSLLLNLSPRILAFSVLHLFPSCFSRLVWVLGLDLPRTICRVCRIGTRAGAFS